MKYLIYFSLTLLFINISNAQPKDIWVDWECNMEVEILAGRFIPGVNVVSVRGDFNGWSLFDLIVDPTDSNIYITPYPTLFPQLEVGDTVTYYKFFYTPNTWEIGDNKFYILTQDDYNNSSATISRAFNNANLQTITYQETTITFEVDCNNAISFVTGLPFPAINTCRLAGGIPPLQWPGTAWPDGDIGLTLPLYDDGTHGDLTAGDLKFTTEVIFPPYTVFDIPYKYGINYGDPINNGGGNDNEAGIGDDHYIQLSQYLVSAKVENVFGTMGLHNRINTTYVPVELTSFIAQLNEHQVFLYWKTASETNNQGFEIERNLNNENWGLVGFVLGHGTTTEIQSYQYIDNINNLASNSITYRLKQIDFDGSFEYSKEIDVEISIPLEYELAQNYPNPFNPGTKIQFSLPSFGSTSLKIFNTLGEEVTILLDKELTVGTYEVEWDAKGLASGVYFYQLKAEGFVETKKMILMK